MVMKLYISGPMTGIVNKNKEAFYALADKLKDLGYSIVNPAELDILDPATKEEYLHNLKRDLKHLLICDGLVLLDNWQASRGATLEVMLAYELEMPIYTLKEDELVEELLIVDKKVLNFSQSSVTRFAVV